MSRWRCERTCRQLHEGKTQAWSRLQAPPRQGRSAAPAAPPQVVASARSGRVYVIRNGTRLAEGGQFRRFRLLRGERHVPPVREHCVESRAAEHLHGPQADARDRRAASGRRCVRFGCRSGSATSAEHRRRSRAWLVTATAVESAATGRVGSGGGRFGGGRCAQRPCGWSWSLVGRPSSPPWPASVSSSPGTGRAETKQDREADSPPPA
jgi:hypothetical protein